MRREEKRRIGGCVLSGEERGGLNEKNCSTS